MHRIKIFLASSKELQQERNELESFVHRKNKQLTKKNIFLELIMWEDFLDTMSKERLQAEYNKAIKDADVFVLLFFTKLGKFTAEEFDVAYRQFKKQGRPLILTYFKNASIDTGQLVYEDVVSALNFKKRLLGLGHYVTEFKNAEGLKNHFYDQLEKINFFLDSPESISNNKPILTKKTERVNSPKWYRKNRNFLFAALAVVMFFSVKYFIDSSSSNGSQEIVNADTTQNDLDTQDVKIDTVKTSPKNKPDTDKPKPLPPPSVKPSTTDNKPSKNEGNSTRERAVEASDLERDKALALEIKTNKGVSDLQYKEGELMRLYFKVNQPCKVRVLYRLADDEIVLFENSRSVTKEEVGKLIEVGKGGWDAAAPFGEEELFVFAQNTAFDKLTTETIDGYTYVLGGLENAVQISKGFKRHGVSTFQSLKITTYK